MGWLVLSCPLIKGMIYLVAHQTVAVASLASI
jgi:hypothetical protein